MPRRYTDEEKRLVLDRLIANHGDVARTADEFRLTTTTVYRWMKQANMQQPGQLQLQQLQLIQHLEPSDSPSLYTERGLGGEVLPPDTTEAFQELHDQLLPIAKILAARITEAIDEAPLNQRMTALSQLIDRIAKLAALLPQPEEEIEYVHEYEYEYEVEGHVEKKDEAEDHHSAQENQTED